MSELKTHIHVRFSMVGERHASHIRLSQGAIRVVRICHRWPLMVRIWDHSTKYLPRTRLLLPFTAAAELRLSSRGELQQQTRPEHVFCVTISWTSNRVPSVINPGPSAAFIHQLSDGYRPHLVQLLLTCWRMWKLTTHFDFLNKLQWHIMSLIENHRYLQGFFSPKCNYLRYQKM